ncbi:hypothetical protein CYY_001064 [Polysphondylium violaceum]|uniref:Uncharacterized protein n=1 Tax=Polysphondylium violaceum TaxID=133409 RepID=A0A8J4Q0M8_9MYCE|nr:hypothetical protein CYY_001064 [Polysphondylium violaceum]
MIEQSASLTNTIVSLYTDEEVFQSLIANRMITNLSGMNLIPSVEVQNKMIELLKTTDQTSIVNSTIISLQNLGKNTGFYIGIKDWDLLINVVSSINHYFTDFQILESSIYPFQSALAIFQYLVKAYEDLFQKDDISPLQLILDNRKRDLLLQNLMYIINICDPNTFNLCLKLLDMLLVLYEELVLVSMAPEIFTQYKNLSNWRKAYFVRSLSNGSAKCKIIAYIISLVSAPSSLLKYHTPMDQLCNLLRGKPTYSTTHHSTPINYASVTFNSTGRRVSQLNNNNTATSSSTSTTSTATNTNTNTTMRAAANAKKETNTTQSFLSVEQASTNFPTDDEPLGQLELYLILMNQLLQCVLSIKTLTTAEHDRIVKESETFFKMAANNKPKMENQVEYDTNISMMKYLIESNKP